MKQTPTSEPIIIWEKWMDPLGSTVDLSNIDDNDTDNDTYDENTDHTNHGIKFNAIVTPLGLVPMNEHTDCTKIFNFWTGHCNFNITKNISNIISEIDGVETLDVFTRYRFRVAFGKAFMDRDVINDINTTIYKYLQ